MRRDVCYSVRKNTIKLDSKVLKVGAAAGQSASKLDDLPNGVPSDGLVESLAQPLARRCPIAAHRTFGHAKRRGDFGRVQSHEVAKFNYFGHALVSCPEVLKGAVKLRQIRTVGDRQFQSFSEVVANPAATPLFGVRPASTINQQLAHHSRRGVEQMRGVLEVAGWPAQQLEHHVVNQSSGLQGGVPGSDTQLARGDSAKVCVNQRQQSIERCAIAFAPATKQVRNAVDAGLVHTRTVAQPRGARKRDSPGRTGGHRTSAV